MIVQVDDGHDGQKYLLFWCDGCKTHHQVPVNGRNGWTWNGSTDFPTLTPSLLVNPGHVVPDVPVCHSFVKEGTVQYLEDSTHQLAGKTLPLEEL